MQPDAIRSVLAATDLGPQGDEVLRAAGRLAAAAGAALHVVHAFELELSGYPEIDGAMPTFQGRIRQAETRLAAQLDRTLPDGMRPASREVVIYAAHRAILDHAAAVRADVIVLGPHRGGGGALLGTTADRVIRSAACPCLVVRGALELPLRRVLVPVDLSDPARGALQAAIVWGERLGAADGALPLARVELDVVHVIPRFFQTEEMGVSHASIGPRLQAQVEAALAGHGAGVTVHEELLWGDGAAAEIVRRAGEWRADLVVLATHGHGAVRRALIGSVASAVARTAPCPVLLVPPAQWSGTDG